VNTEERQLAEMLHRVTPEPPRGVTVEDIAFRLANEAGSRAPRGGHREPRPRRRPARGSRGPSRRGRGGAGRGWAPVLAAASVVVVAGASAGIATALSSHHSPAGSSQDGMPTSSASVSSPPASTTPTSPSTSNGATWPPEQVADGMWGAELINRQTFTQASLVAGNGSLYAFSPGFLDRISPVTGNGLAHVPYNSPIAGFPNRPVLTGNTVWVLSSYAGSSVVLAGYNGSTLASAGTISVPVSGQVASAPEGVLTSGSDGYLYVAAGSAIAVVNPQTRQVIRQIPVSGTVSSVAVAPGGSKVYAGTGAFQLTAYDPATGARLGSSAVSGIGSFGGNLVATPGGVWGTMGIGMSEWVWFAPNGNLSRVVRVSQGPGAGLDSVPSYSGGVVWIGGSQELACVNPATGQKMVAAVIPTDNGIGEYFGNITVAGGRTYALFQNQAAQQSGVATLTPPGGCSG